GREVIRAVREADGLELVAAIDRHELGADAGELAGAGQSGVAVESDLEAALTRTQPHVLVDFTQPDSVMGNVRAALAQKVSPVVGTTGLNPGDLAEIERTAQEQGVGAFVAPIFAIDAVL